MRKFIFKCIVFLFIIGIPFLVLNYAYKNTNYYKNQNEMYELTYYPDNITLCNLGNSHESAGIVYKQFYNGSANNFATSAQPFYYSYQVLVSAEDSISEGAVVLIPISYYDWYYDYKELFSSIETYNNRYYRVMGPNQILKFDLETYFNVGLFPILTAKEDIKYIFDDIAEPQIEPDNFTVVNNIDAYATNKYNSWCNEVMELGENKDVVYEDNLKWFIAIIEYCKEKNYTPVIICSPVTSQLTKKFDEEFMCDFDEKNQYIRDMYPEILFLDYSRDDEFVDTLEYFRDSDHLNSAGANAYTKRLLNDLVYYEVLKPNSLR